MRISNWPDFLNAFVEAKRERPFAWGENDCCLFAADCVLALTGIDPAASFRGSYSSALGSARLQAECGGVEQIADDAAALHGWPAIAPAFAQRGDLVSFEMPSGMAIGICLGKNAVFAGADGIVFQPTLSCRRAWRIL
jgi:hypothetical protein